MGASTTSSSSSPTPAVVGGERCSNCGYDLRGIVSHQCPECAAWRIWRRMVFLDPAEFHRARAALKAANVPMQIVDPATGMNGLLNITLGQITPGEIRVGRPDLQRAMETLDAADIFVPLPVVDRREPLCPCCHSPADLQQEQAEPICSVCGVEFAWIDVETDTLGEVGPDAHQPVARAISPRQAAIARVVATVAGSIAVIIAAEAYSRRQNWLELPDWPISLFGLWMGLIALAALWDLRRAATDGA